MHLIRPSNSGGFRHYQRRNGSCLAANLDHPSVSPVPEPYDGPSSEDKEHRDANTDQERFFFGYVPISQEVKLQEGHPNAHASAIHGPVIPPFDVSGTVTQGVRVGKHLPDL